jgi:hypothetical protein
MKDKYTGGKWRISSSTIIVTDEARIITNCLPIPIPEISIDLQECMANAKRIVTCINVLEGISNEALESGVVGEMMELVRVIRDPKLTQDETMKVALEMGIVILAKLKGNE